MRRKKYRSFGPVTLSYFPFRDKNGVGVGLPVVKTIVPDQMLRINGSTGKVLLNREGLAEVAKE